MGVPTPQCLKTQPSNTEISERTKHKNEDFPGARGTCGPEVPYAIENLVP